MDIIILKTINVKAQCYYLAAAKVSLFISALKIHIFNIQLIKILTAAKRNFL